MFCSCGPNLVILAWTRDKLSRGQASAYRTHRQTDAANDNTRRPKLASGKNGRHFVDDNFERIFLIEFLLNFYWILFLRLQLTPNQHWLRQWLVAYLVPSLYLNQCWPSSLTRICGIGGDELSAKSFHISVTICNILTIYGQEEFLPTDCSLENGPSQWKNMLHM